MDGLFLKIQNLQVYLSGIWLKKRYIALVAWILCTALWLAISTLPNQYESSAKVFADTKSLLKPLLSGMAVHTDTDSDIQTIAQTLLSRPNLEKIAQESDLHIGANTPERYESMLRELRSNISIRGSRRTNVYDISFTHPDPEVAHLVVESTLQQFMNTIMKQGQMDTDVATGFLERQIVEYQKRLETAEQRIARFKRDNQHLLPQHGGSYYQSLSAKNQQLREVKNLIEEKNSSRQAILDYAKSGPQEGRRLSDLAPSQAQDPVTNLRLMRDELLSKYTSNHPTIIALNAQIDNAGESNRHSSPIADSEMDNAIHGTSLSPEIEQLIAVLTAEIGALQVRESVLITDLDDLSSKLYLIPDIEAQLISLNRDHEVTSRQYNELLKRLDSAELSRDMSQNTNEIKFKIIDPPLVPLFAAGPPRQIMYIAAFLFSLGAGVAVSLLISQSSAVISSHAHLSSVVKGNIIGVLPTPESLSRRGVAFLKHSVFFALISSLFVALVIILLYESKYGHSVLVGLNLVGGV